MWSTWWATRLSRRTTPRRSSRTRHPLPQRTASCRFTWSCQKQVDAFLDEGLRAITAVVDEWPLIVVDPDTAPEDFLDAILWELGDPFGWLNLPIAKKRKLAIWMHALVALKGGGPGIVAAIRLLLEIEVQVHVYGWGPAPLGEAIIGDTWILGSDDEDDLYTFWVIVDEQLDTDTRNKMDQIIRVMKVANERHIIAEPDTIVVPDHWALGFSDMGVETLLHA